MFDFSGIYVVLEGSSERKSDALFDAVLQAGVRLIQYRSKAGINRELVRSMCLRAREMQAHLIVNDDVEAALDAGGVHLGQEDLGRCSRSTLRKRLGSRILGISCATPQEAREAEQLGADYVGVGPFKTTSSKSDAGPAIGVAGIHAVVQATRLPVAAIGGIGIDDLPAITSSGARMAAVISAVAGAQDPGRAARALVERWKALVLQS